MAPVEAPSRSEQLKAYEVGSKVYDHIVEIHHNIATVANIYLVATGVLWGAVSTNTLKVPTAAAMVILCFHLLGSVAVLQTLAASLNAISLRHEFLPAFATAYYPDIQQIGKASFSKVFGSPESVKAQFARWGRQRLLWYLIPVAGFTGSVFFICWLVC